MNEMQVRRSECAASSAVATPPLPFSSCKPAAGATRGACSGGDTAGDTIALRPQGNKGQFSSHAGAAVRVVCSTAGYVVYLVARRSSPTNSRRCER
ncbi:MAG TPA: hypothetical protein PKL26_08235 [Methanolinea sp.]|nr:hypothetical protein [Methanolinea sp.]